MIVRNPGIAPFNQQFVLKNYQIIDPMQLV